DRGEEYNILDDSDIDDIQSDPSFQQIASKIICSDLDNNGFQVCQQGLSADTPATGATEDTIGQNTSPPIAGTDSIFEDSDNDDKDDDDNNNNDDNGDD
ncbi:MAG: hypothetical protein WA941_16865, partial [Nitrososphaeraceae archaeon]